MQDSEQATPDTVRVPQADTKKVREFTNPDASQHTDKPGIQWEDMQKYVDKMFGKVQKSWLN